MKLKEPVENNIQQRIYQRLQPLFEAKAYQIVALNYTNRQKMAHFSLAVFHPEGIDLEVCTELHRIACVEIEMLQTEGLKVCESQDFSIEVSSPGLNRSLRTRREFDIFTGQSIRCLCQNNQWVLATLVSLEEQVDVLEQDVLFSQREISRIIVHMRKEQTPSLDGVLKSQTDASEAISLPLSEILRVELNH